DRLRGDPEDAFLDAGGGAGPRHPQRPADLADLVRGPAGLAADPTSWWREPAAVSLLGRLPPRSGWWLALVLPALLGQAAVLWYGLRHQHFGSILDTELLAGALFVLAVLGLWRYRGPAAGALVLAGAVLLQCSALGAGPSSSDDVYRYVWDAKVQLAGIDPYRYPPAAPELDRLRSAALFPPARPGCVWKLPDGRCSRVNRPEVRTIYPPVAEAAFVLARLASFGRSDGPFPLQVFGAIGALAVSLLLLRVCRARGDPVWRAALWAWCPVTAVE